MNFLTSGAKPTDEETRPKYVTRKEQKQQQRQKPPRIKAITSVNERREKLGVFIPHEHPMPMFVPGFEPNPAAFHVAPPAQYYRHPYFQYGPHQIHRFHNPVFNAPSTQEQPKALMKPGEGLGFRGPHPGYGPVPFLPEQGSFPAPSSNFPPKFRGPHPGYGPTPFVSGPFPPGFDEQVKPEMDNATNFEEENEVPKRGSEEGESIGLEATEKLSSQIGAALGMLQGLS